MKDIKIISHSTRLLNSEKGLSSGQSLLFEKAISAALATLNEYGPVIFLIPALTRKIRRKKNTIVSTHKQFCALFENWANISGTLTSENLLKTRSNAIAIWIDLTMPLKSATEPWVRRESCTGFISSAIANNNYWLMETDQLYTT